MSWAFALVSLGSTLRFWRSRFNASLEEPELEEAGAETKIVSPKSGQILGMNHANKGDKFDVDIPLDEAAAGGI